MTIRTEFHTQKKAKVNPMPHKRQGITVQLEAVVLSAENVFSHQVAQAQGRTASSENVVF